MFAKDPAFVGEATIDLGVHDLALVERMVVPAQQRGGEQFA
jgi:hypothetical protein